MEWKKEQAVKLYSEGRITLERAAMEVGISVREMIDYMKRRKKPAQYTLEDLEEDMKHFYERLAE
jgi:predicted HTH domain antitoxin